MEFQEKVLNLCSRIPKGKVSTYKEIGIVLNGKGQVYRAVGRALHNNKNPVVVPCHRVVCFDGSVGGYAGGTAKKIELLRKEGVFVEKGKIVDFEKKLFKF